MRQKTLDQVLRLTLQGMLAEQFRATHLHDMRGGLQAIRNSLELMTRASKASGDGTAAVDRATELAKRALAGHERTLETVLDHLVLIDEEPTSVDVAALLAEVLAFLQNAIVSKGLSPAVPQTGRIRAIGEPRKLRLCMLALISNAIDYLPAGSALNVGLYSDTEEFFLEIPGGQLYETVNLSDEATSLPGTIEQRELSLRVCRQIVSAQGGRIVFRSDESTDGILQICHPVQNG